MGSLLETWIGRSTRIFLWEMGNTEGIKPMQWQGEMGGDNRNREKGCRKELYLRGAPAGSQI